MKRVAWNKGRSWAESVRKRISQSLKGRSVWNKGKSWSEEIKKKISESSKGRSAWNKGLSRTEKDKQKISQSLKGRTVWNKGKPRTEEERKKISQALKGKTVWNKGKKWSKQVKRKILLKQLANAYNLKIPIRTKNRVGKRMRFLILSRDKYTCQYCGRKAPNVVLEVDEIYPRSKGGKVGPDNCITACVDCNRGKSNLVLK